MQCNVCNHTVGDSVLFCSHCGTQLLTVHEVECNTHAGVAANAVCVVCGTPTCDSCSDVRDGIHFCKNKHHNIYRDEFTMLVATSSWFNADLIVKNLELKGVHAVSFTLQQFVKSQSLNDTTVTHIYVCRETTDAAKNILQELDIMDFNNDK